MSFVIGFHLLLLARCDPADDPPTAVTLSQIRPLQSFMQEFGTSAMLWGMLDETPNLLVGRFHLDCHHFGLRGQ